MEALLNVVITLILVVVVYQLAALSLFAIQRPKYTFGIWRKFSFKGAFLTCLALILVIIPSILILEYGPSFLTWGWTTPIYGEPRNVLINPFPNEEMTNADEEDGQLSKRQSSSMQDKKVMVMFIVFLIWLSLLSPIISLREELWFRSGVYTHLGMIKASFLFGLVHMLVGVPILAVFSLGTLGYFLAIVYVRKRKELLQNFTIDETLEEAYGTYITHDLFMVEIDHSCDGDKLVDQLLWKIEGADSGVREYVVARRNIEKEALLEAAAYHSMSHHILFGLAILTLVLRLILS